jgi:glycosyltransferase involved in cell wall biosynthesis
MKEFSRMAPEIQLSIVGSNVPPEVASLEAHNIRVLGYVEDLDKVLDAARVSIAPMRFGAGLKGKVARSMANGTPVVASSIAIEGMDLEPGVHYLLANTTKEFLAQILSVYNDETLWNQVSLNSKKASEMLWGFEAGLKNIGELLKRLGIEIDSPQQKVRFL